MGTTPPNQPPFTPGDPNAPRFDANAPFDPTNVNDPRYDPSRDPRYDPRWQKAQERFYRDQQRMADRQGRAQQKAAEAAWKAQSRAQRDQWKMYWQGQRRTSLVGPVLLIALGVIFFLIHAGKVSAVTFFGWYGHWWPFLLIIIGLLRLAEWAIDRARAPQGAPPLRYGMGPGVGLLLVLLVAAGFFAHTVQWTADERGWGFLNFKGEGMEHLFGQKHEEDASPVLRTIAAGGTLSIVNPRGDISVAGTSDDGQIHLSVHKSAFTSSDDTATARLNDLSPVFEGADDNLTLRVPSVANSQADVTLLVPPTTHVLVNSTRGDVHVTNLKMPLAISADNGDVEVAAITGAVEVNTNNRHHDINVRSVSGDTIVNGTGDEVTLSDITGKASMRGDFFGGASVQRVSGQVEYKSSRTDLTFAHLYGSFSIDRDDLQADQVVGPSLVQTRSRNVTLNKVSGELKVVNNHGDVTIDAVPQNDKAAALAAITVDNQNGSVKITLPEKAKFNLQAETSEGDVHSEFGSTANTGKGVLGGAVNGGGPQVRVNTSHGDINISRNNEGVLTPLAPAPKLSGFGSIPSPPPPPAMPTMPGFSMGAEDSRRAAAEAREQARQAAQQARETARQATQDAHEQARQAAEEAREAMREAQGKAREAQRLAREAAKQKN